MGDGGRNYQRIVQMLADAGADVMLPSARDGVTPLEHARAGGHRRIEAILRAAGATR